MKIFFTTLSFTLISFVGLCQGIIDTAITINLMGVEFDGVKRYATGIDGEDDYKLQGYYFLPDSQQSINVIPYLDVQYIEDAETGEFIQSTDTFTTRSAHSFLGNIGRDSLTVILNGTIHINENDKRKNIDKKFTISISNTQVFVSYASDSRELTEALSKLNSGDLVFLEDLNLLPRDQFRSWIRPVYWIIK